MINAAKRKASFIGIVFTASTLIAGSAIAQDVANPNATAKPAASSVDRPNRGSSMDDVRQQYGQPRQVINAVGEPPITRWIYDSFTVYFEHNHVIHSVVEGQQPSAN